VGKFILFLCQLSSIVTYQILKSAYFHWVIKKLKGAVCNCDHQHCSNNPQILSGCLSKVQGRRVICVPIHDGSAARKTDVLCPRYNPSRQEAACSPNSDHLLLYLLPYSRHAKERCRPHFHHRVTQGTLSDVDKCVHWSPQETLTLI